MSEWLSAHEIRTDWCAEDPQANRLREIEATIPCGLRSTNLNNTGGCGELFFTELGRDLHHEEDHHISTTAEKLRLTRYDPVFRPMAEREHSPQHEKVGDYPKPPRKPRRMWWDLPEDGSGIAE